VEAQPVPQGDGAGPAVILEQVAGGHLRMGAELVVHAVERVPDHVAMVADDVGGDRDRVQPAEIGLWHEAQHARPGRLRERRRGEQPAPGAEQGASPDHARFMFQ
jgi:hypothetical protein